MLRSLVDPAVIVAADVSPALAQNAGRRFDIPAQPLASALLAFARQSDLLILISPDLAEGRRSRAVRAVLPPDAALAQLLRDTDLRAVPNPKGGYRVERIGTGRSFAADGPPFVTGATGTDQAS